MNFIITEEEYNVIDSVRGQLDVMAGLLDMGGSAPPSCTASDMALFMTAQVEATNAVLRKIDARYEAEREQIEAEARMQAERKKRETEALMQSLKTGNKAGTVPAKTSQRKREKLPGVKARATEAA